jgi:hypothetical protein
MEPAHATPIAAHVTLPGDDDATKSAANPDPYHVANVGNVLGELIRHLRDDTRQFDEPKAQALFETSAEVLQGLQTAFRHYETAQSPR